MKKWDRSLGTSKQEQEIITPKAPRGRRLAYHVQSEPEESGIARFMAALMRSDPNSAMTKNNKQRRRDVFKNRQGDR